MLQNIALLGLQDVYVMAVITYSAIIAARIYSEFLAFSFQDKQALYTCEVTEMFYLCIHGNKKFILEL